MRIWIVELVLASDLVITEGMKPVSYFIGSVRKLELVSCISTSVPLRRKS